jgi:hypothetical protein
VRVGIARAALVTAFGEDPAKVAARVRAGETAVRGADPPAPAGDRVAPCDVTVDGLLRRRKDRKLLAPAARLLLVAATRAVADGAPDAWGAFVGVGDEPPTDELEAALLAAEAGGRLDAARLGAAGLAAYPPLASLPTLPNLALAHAAIQLGLRGPTGTCAGEGAAGLAALHEAAVAVAEGRCPVALAAAADSLIHWSHGRDRARRGLDVPRGEAAAALVIVPDGAPEARWWIDVEPVRYGGPPSPEPPHRAALGDCGAADGLLALVLAVVSGSSGGWGYTDGTGRASALCWGPSAGAP